MNAVQDAPLGLISFLSFAFSILAAVSAIDMYKLLRTGEFGKTWRLLITASVMLALLQVLRMAEVLNLRSIAEARLSQIVELCFVMTLAYAFYMQRKLFSQEYKQSDEIEEEDSIAGEEAEQTFFEEYEDGNSLPIERPASLDESASAPPRSWAKYENVDISRPAP